MLKRKISISFIKNRLQSIRDEFKDSSFWKDRWFEFRKQLEGDKMGIFRWILMKFIIFKIKIWFQMDMSNFKFSFQNNPIYLCQNQKRFYEIKLGTDWRNGWLSNKYSYLDCSNGIVIMRKGILLQNSVNSELPCKVSEMRHEFARKSWNYSLCWFSLFRWRY